MKMQTLLTLEVSHDGDVLEIIGDPEMIVFEFRHFKKGFLVDASISGYGSQIAALHAGMRYVVKVIPTL